MNLSSQKMFWLTLVIALVIMQLPIVSIPFKWLESYFHEISHGFAAIVTGGTIIQIQLFPNGAGLCTTQGGSRFVVSFMGYFGATIWGFLLYRLAQASQQKAKLIIALIASLLVLSMIFWVRDLLTLIILLIVLALVLSAFKVSSVKYVQLILKVMAMMVLLNSLMSPMYLIDGRALGDGATLAKLTFIPEIVWVVIWFSFALFCAFVLSKRSKVSS